MSVVLDELRFDIPTAVKPTVSRRVSPTLLLVGCAFVVRLLLMIAQHGLHWQDMPIRDDSSLFNEATNIAASIANGYGFTSPMVGVLDGAGYTGPSSWVGPVYPYLCAAVFKIFGLFSQPSFVVIIMVQCLFSALVCVPIIRIGERTVGRKAGIVAASLWAFFPWYGKWAVTWIWEIDLSALLFAWLFWFALRLGETSLKEEDDPHVKLWLAFGATWGLALLVNPALMTLLPISAIWIIHQRRQHSRPWLHHSLLAALACVIVVSPWLVRNRLVFGEWTFIRSNFGFEFALGNYPGANGRGWLGLHPMGNKAEFDAYSRGELAYVKAKSQLAWKFVREHPREFVDLTLHRIPWFWDGSAMRFNYKARWFWMPWSFLITSILLFPTLYIAWKRRVHGWQLFLGAVLLYPIPYYLTYSQVRYRHVLEPLMLLLLAYAAVETIRYMQSRRHLASTSA